MNAVPPIDGRVGHVGGIESVTVDGRRWYFGFDYSSDVVVSPLIDDPDGMAAFAAEHMRQRDGEHDARYWRELVDLSVEQSDLASDEDRRFTSERLAAERLTPGYHLRYLLGAAGGWEDSFLSEPAVQVGLSALGIDEADRNWECIDACIEATTTLEGADTTRMAREAAARQVMARYIEFVLDAAPANWPHVFRALRAANGAQPARD